jgi:hypothetical protein
VFGLRAEDVVFRVSDSGLVYGVGLRVHGSRLRV